MGAKNSTNENITYLKLRAKTSDTDPTPFFGKNEKKGGSYEITEKFDSVDGYLIEITHESYEFEGEKKQKCKMKLKDADGSLTVLESNFNNLLYGILNSIASCGPLNPLGFIDMKVYLGKGKDGGKQYPGVFVKNNGEQIKWLYKWEELPKAEKVPIGNTGKTYLDDSNVIKFWQGEIEKINAVLKPGQQAKAMQPSEPIHSEEIMPIDDDSLPF